MLNRKSTFILAVIIIAVLILAIDRVFGSRWKFIAPMPHGRYWHDAVIGPKGKIYVMGGQVYEVAKGFKKGKGMDGWMIRKYNDGIFSNLSYDPGKDRWQYCRNVPGRTYPGVTIKVYDPVNDRWSALVRPKNKPYQEYPRGVYDHVGKKTIREKVTAEELEQEGYYVYTTSLVREGVGVAVVKGKDGNIHWLGGKGMWTGYGENIVLTYNPVTDKWSEAVWKFIRKGVTGGSYKTEYRTQVPPMLEARIKHEAVAAADGKIYVIGGMRFVNRPPKGSVITVSKTVECYDPETNRWSYKAPLKQELMSFAAVLDRDNKISAGLPGTNCYLKPLPWIRWKSTTR
jgi:hypothetical protein